MVPQPKCKANRSRSYNRTIDYKIFIHRFTEFIFRLAEELDETKKRFDETLVMVETMKDTSKHKNETSREDEEEEGDLRDKLTKAEKDVKVQSYPQRTRLQRRQYGIYTVCFLFSFFVKSLNKP